MPPVKPMRYMLPFCRICASEGLLIATICKNIDDVAHDANRFPIRNDITRGWCRLGVIHIGFTPPVRRTVSGDPASLEQPARTRAPQSAVAPKILHGQEKTRPPKCGWRAFRTSRSDERRVGAQRRS